MEDKIKPWNKERPWLAQTTGHFEPLKGVVLKDMFVPVEEMRTLSKWLLETADLLDKDAGVM